jgi:hypothetical protein
MQVMTKLLEQTIARIRDLPDDLQDAAAGALLEYLDGLRDLQISDEQLAEVRRRRASGDRSFFSVDEARQRLLSARS